MRKLTNYRVIAGKNKDGKNIQIWEHREKKGLPYLITVNGIVVEEAYSNSVEYVCNNLALCNGFVFDENMDEYNGCPFYFEEFDGFHCIYDGTQLDCPFRNDPYE